MQDAFAKIRRNEYVSAYVRTGGKKTGARKSSIRIECPPFAVHYYWPTFFLAVELFRARVSPL